MHFTFSNSSSSCLVQFQSNSLLALGLKILLYISMVFLTREGVGRYFMPPPTFSFCGTDAVILGSGQIKLPPFLGLSSSDSFESKRSGGNGICSVLIFVGPDGESHRPTIDNGLLRSWLTQGLKTNVFFVYIFHNDTKWSVCFANVWTNWHLSNIAFGGLTSHLLQSSRIAKSQNLWWWVKEN